AFVNGFDISDPKLITYFKTGLDYPVREFLMQHSLFLSIFIPFIPVKRSTAQVFFVPPCKGSESHSMLAGNPVYFPGAAFFQEFKIQILIATGAAIEERYSQRRRITRYDNFRCLDIILPALAEILGIDEVIRVILPVRFRADPFSQTGRYKRPHFGLFV